MLALNNTKHCLIIRLLTATGLALTLLSTPIARAETAEALVVEPAPALTAEELEKLAGPIALYPDDLLAVVLPASTYPLQIVSAARFRTDPDNDHAEPDEDWDESIVALLNYPEALALLNEDIDWTWELGQAVTDQEEALMQAIQRIRQEAYAAGSIDSDDKQTVYVKDKAIVIEPADDEVIYVPYYEPEQVVRHHTTQVYHYYPTAYPVYYYPYRAGHAFYDDGFWGLSSFFTLSWGNHHLHHYRHGHRHHRYYSHRYHDYHYRYTRQYLATPTVHRRWAHRRGYDYAYNGHWRPRHRHYGARPLRRSYREGYRDGYRDYRREDHTYRPHRKRHIDRRGRHRYASMQENRSAFRPTLRDRRQDRPVNARRPDQRSLAQRHLEQRNLDQRSLDQAEHPMTVVPDAQSRLDRAKKADRARSGNSSQVPFEMVNERGAPPSSIHRDLQRERNAVARDNRQTALSGQNRRPSVRERNTPFQAKRVQSQRPTLRSDRRSATDQGLRRNPERISRADNRRIQTIDRPQRLARQNTRNPRPEQVQPRVQRRQADSRTARRNPQALQHVQSQQRQRPGMRTPKTERHANVRSTHRPDFRRSVKERTQPRRVAPAAPRTRAQPSKRQPRTERSRSHRAEGRGLSSRMQM